MMRPLQRRVAHLEAVTVDDRVWRAWVGQPLVTWPIEAREVFMQQWDNHAPGTKQVFDSFTDEEIDALCRETRAEVRADIEARIARGVEAGRLSPATVAAIRAAVADIAAPLPPGTLLDPDASLAEVEARFARVEALFEENADASH